MSRTETVELTVLCLVENEDKILIEDRVKGSWTGSSLPGGHVEPGETIVEAVIREIKEETGLDITGPRLAGVKDFPIDNGVDNGRYIVFLFRTDSFTGELRSSDEGCVRWVSRDSLSELNAVEDFFDTLRIIDDPKLSELSYQKSTWHETYTSQ